MSNGTNIDRRRFFGTTATGIIAAHLGVLGSATAQSTGAEPGSATVSPANSSFASLKQIDAGLLNVGYAEDGPANGPAVILLHGWPYDIHSFVDVAPLLVARGYRVIVPYMRGYGTTRFLSASTFRNCQQTVCALDVIALMDALKIEKAVIGAFDLGARSADIIPALWPERCKALVSVSGYLITNLKFWQDVPLVPKAEYGWWYQYYFATPRGIEGYTKYTHDFNKLIWTIVSPNWRFSDATFDRTAAAFDNPDHVALTIHNYRWRQSLASGEAKYDDLEAKLQVNPVITVPTITITSDFDGDSDGSAFRDKFSGKYEHRLFKGIGHNVPQEAPQAFAQAVIDVDAF